MRKRKYRAFVEHPYAEYLKRHDVEVDETVYRWAYSPAQVYYILQREFPGRYIHGIAEVTGEEVNEEPGEQLRLI